MNNDSSNEINPDDDPMLRPFKEEHAANSSESQLGAPDAPAPEASETTKSAPPQQTYPPKSDFIGTLLSEGFRATAVVAFRNEILAAAGNPSDPVLRIMIEQLVAAHIMVVQMHQRALQAEDPDAFEAFSRAAARLSTELRRMAIAIAQFPMLRRSR